MATILPFPVDKVVPVWGLTRPECEAVHAEAAALMQQGCATGICVQNDGQYMCVFDFRGAPYFIGREERICYLFAPDETLVAESPRFEVVLRALVEALSAAAG